MSGKGYSFRVDPSPSGGWSVWFPDLPGCEGWVDNWSEIGEEAKAISRMWFESEIEQGHNIPEPADHSLEERWPQGTNAESGSGQHVIGVSDVAKRLGVSERRVQALAKERVVGRRFGNYLVFTEPDIERLRPNAPGRPRSVSALTAD